MTTASASFYAATAFSLASSIYVAFATLHVVLFLRTTRERSGNLPPVPILKPLCGVDVQLYENSLAKDKWEFVVRALSRLLDFEKLPEFLAGLGFTSVTFSYPLTHLASNFLGFSESEIVSYTRAELIEAFEKVKAFKKKFLVVNPTPSLQEMQRHLRNEEQLFPCLGGFRFFYLDWRLQFWRCHFWEEPMCSIYEFDETQLVREGCIAA